MKRSEIAEILTEMLGVTAGDADHAAGTILAQLGAESRETTQYGVRTTGGGKQHVDTSYNGGFKTADGALFAAKNGYISAVQTEAVQRTVTTIYGPWTAIEDKDN